jgi:multiple sugar transport system ATP-binding protein
VILGIRPQDFADASTADPALPSIEVETAVVEELGSATHVLFTIDAPPVDVDSVRAASDDKERASLLATDRRALFTAEVAEGTPVRPGTKLQLAVDPTRLHFFDPGTSEALRGGVLASA